VVDEHDNQYACRCMRVVHIKEQLMSVAFVFEEKVEEEIRRARAEAAIFAELIRDVAQIGPDFLKDVGQPAG